MSPSHRLRATAADTVGSTRTVKQRHVSKDPYVSITSRPAGILGRAAERDLVRTTLARAASREGTVVRVVGDPGVGKSALLAAVRADADESAMTVLETRGSAAESHLPFAALHRLVAPLLERPLALPPAQRWALDAALGRGAHVPLPDRFLVGLAVLELLADAATEAPVLLLVDDRHWLDEPTAGTLDFVGRRIGREPVVLVTAQREPEDSAMRDDAVVVHLGGLDAEDAGLLLDRAHPELPAEVRARVLSLAQGNPLALVELPKAQGPSATTADGPPALTRRLEAAFGERIAALPRSTELALLVAALDDAGALGRLGEVAPLLGLADASEAVFAPAVEAGLVRFAGGGLTFRHPLVSAAVVAGADQQDRRRVHEALARVVREPDRAAWHRTAGTLTPDEELATEVDAAAEHAAGRGDANLAHTLFARSAQLSTDPARRAHRTLRAAELAFQLGRPSLVRSFVQAVRLTDLTPADRARLVGLEMAFDDGVPEGRGAVRRFVASAGAALDAGEDRVAGALLVIAARHTYWAGTSDELGDEILAVADRLDAPVAQALVHVAEAFLRPFDRGDGLLPALDTAAASAVDDETTALLGQAAFVIGDFRRTLHLTQRAETGLRRDGHVGLLAGALVLETFASLYLGRWDVTTTASDEAARLAAETRQPVWAACARLGQANVLALRGDREAADAITDEVARTALVQDIPAGINGVQLARGLAALGSGDAETAWHELHRMFVAGDAAFHAPQSVWALDYLAEAAALSGHRDEARKVVEATAARVEGANAPGVLRALSLARLVLARDEEVPAALAAATAVPSTAWHRARRDLAHGSWLRGEGDGEGAQPLLRAAATTFQTIGAPAWSSLACRELAAAGAPPAPTREPASWSRLSAQELQVATLAAQGLSNREIGERLFLSHRTVAAHLYRAFPKLGVKSRNQLHLVLSNRAEA